MKLGIVNSDIFKKHDTGLEHSENYKRLNAIESELKSRKIYNELKYIKNKPIDFEQLYKVHSPEYVKSVKDFCFNGGGWIDKDSIASTDSYDVALNAAGSVLESVDQIFTNQIDRAFCMIRPPGHHAMPDVSMGFCLFSNLSLGAVYAQEKYGIDRILVLDWDAHHGNGTEKIFYNSDKVFTVSWHQENNWPYTGKIEEIGEGQGLGYNMNIPIPEGFTDQAFIETFDNLIVPLAKSYKPQLIILAAGYDAHWKDHLSKLNMTSPVYNVLSKKIMSLSEELCDGKVLATLEGGYNLDALAECSCNTLEYMFDTDKKILDTTAKDKEENVEYIKKIISNIIELQPLLK